jgi:hypothetical protein
VPLFVHLLASSKDAEDQLIWRSGGGSSSRLRQPTGTAADVVWRGGGGSSSRILQPTGTAADVVWPGGGGSSSHLRQPTGTRPVERWRQGKDGAGRGERGREARTAEKEAARAMAANPNPSGERSLGRGEIKNESLGWGRFAVQGQFIRKYSEVGRLTSTTALREAREAGKSTPGPAFPQTRSVVHFPTATSRQRFAVCCCLFQILLLVTKSRSRSPNKQSPSRGR